MAETAMRRTMKVTNRMVLQANKKLSLRKTTSNNVCTRVGAWVISPGRIANSFAGAEEAPGET
jgi:hypothetical protein